jgi:S1-C subfamily serine protease
VITRINRIPITDAAHLRNLVALTGPGRVSVELQRAGKSVVIQVDLVEAPRDIGPDPEVVSSVDLPE